LRKEVRGYGGPGRAPASARGDRGSEGGVLPRHAVSPYSFFWMILLILSLKGVYNEIPVVRFILAVPLDTFEYLTSAEDYNLVSAWPLMEIKDVEIYILSA
jgi:hypothetical protein